jgi:hypothetical protein
VHRHSWQMEHGGLPSETVVDPVRWPDGPICQLGATEPKGDGNTAAASSGTPNMGEFGALLLREQHVRVRWATAAVGRRPWQRVMDGLLAEFSLGWSPRMVLTARRASTGTWRGTPELIGGHSESWNRPGLPSPAVGCPLTSGFTQYGVPELLHRYMGFGGSPEPNSKRPRKGTEMLGAVV